MAEIIIRNSNVSALAPNDVAIMTSTKKAPSSVVVQNSVVELAGIYAGIRAKSNTTSDAEIFVIENSLIVTVDKTNANYKALDEMDNATSSDGADGIDENSQVISPKDCVIVLKEDGTWDIPDNGTILVNGQENNYVYGGVIKPTGEVLPYITSVNDDEFVDINEALSVANEGDNVLLLVSDGVDEVILPLGITLTSDSAVKVTADEFGYKIKEEIVDEKYVYSVIPLDKFKVIYFSNDLSNKIIVREVFEQSKLNLKKDIFVASKNMQFSHWTINGIDYSPDDNYFVTDDIEVYANWEQSNNPNTNDGIETSIYIGLISTISVSVSVLYFFRKRTAITL